MYINPKIFSEKMDLYEEVYDLVKQIPKGMVSTYGLIARALGDEIASRAVGKILAENENLDAISCYKVVHQDGNIGKYRCGKGRKRELLKKDGINIEDDRIKNFGELLFKDFETSCPLWSCREEQLELRKKISLENELKDIETVGGIDVAYDGRKAYGAYIGMNKKREIIERKVICTEVNFPYIPTYFSYRELPVIEKLMDKIEMPTILMLDGNGLIHPYGIGLASHVGIVFDKPTIGIAKSLLCGEVKNGKIIDGKELLGYELKSKSSKKPIYISPGNKTSFELSLEITQHFCKFRIPEPIRKAHLFANEMKKSSRY